MSLQICRCFQVTFLALVLLVPIAFPLEISEDTLKAIKHNKYYASGFAPSKTRSPDISLANATGAAALAKLEYKINRIILNKISSRSHTDENNFTRALLEYVEDYNATTGSLMQSGMGVENCVVSVAENMIAVYRMVRRFRNYIQPWILEQKKRKASPFQTEVLEAIIPSGKSLDLYTSDFHLSLIPIIVTQFYLDWKAEDICKGAVKGMELGSTLKAVNCLEIGAHAIASGMYPIGIEWVEQAISKVTYENDTSVNLQLATDVLEKAYAKHDERWRPKNLVRLEETFYVTRLNGSMNAMDQKLSRKWRKETEYVTKDVELEAQDTEGFSKMCQGKVEQSEKVKSRLFCWLETSIHPTWKIGPLKVELLSGFPHDVVLFHDVIGESLKEDFIEYGTPRRSPGRFNQPVATPKTRLSFGVGVMEYPQLESRLNGLTERITGLRTKYAMQNYISTYPAGGHMNLHTDYMRSKDDEDELITTVLYYLTAPEIGGETIIPYSKIYLKPPAGSAVLWYFPYKSGVLRKGRAHGSCPLVKGQKWINVKGLHYVIQTHLLCDMDEHARFEYLVNGKSKYT